MLISIRDEGAISDQNIAIKLLPEELDPYLNRGLAEEMLNQWDAAIEDYSWILERDPDNADALYNLGNVQNSLGNWEKAGVFFNKAMEKKLDFPMARSSKALADYQNDQLEEAESELRSLIRKHPMFADARAALTALLWQRGLVGEAESNWAAALGLDNRYSQTDWLLNIRRWPPKPIKDLKAFLDLKKS